MCKAVCLCGGFWGEGEGVVAFLVKRCFGIVV